MADRVTARMCADKVAEIRGKQATAFVIADRLELNALVFNNLELLLTLAEKALKYEEDELTP